MTDKTAGTFISRAQQELDRMVRDAICVTDPRGHPQICNENPRIVNIVSTVFLFPPQSNNMMLIESLALSLGGMAKSAPRRFAATILRISDFVGTTTCLVFRTGIIVVAGARSREHGRMAAQFYRRLISRVENLFVDPESGKVVRSTLQGRLCFHNWQVQTIVASSSLHCRPDVSLLAKIAPDVANWDPELFPALVLAVWLRPKDQCQCIPSPSTSGAGAGDTNCQCRCTTLVFDTGNVVITGSTSVEDVNKCKANIFAVFGNKLMQNDKPLLPSDKRYEDRWKQVLNMDFLRMRKSRKKKHKSSPQHAVAQQQHVGEELHLDFTCSVLELACRLGQLDNVQYLLQIDSRDAQNILQALPHWEVDGSTAEALQRILSAATL